MRAVIYARYSTDLQREASIENQVRVCRHRIEGEGWSLVATYSDAASSGASRLRSTISSSVRRQATCDRGATANLRFPTLWQRQSTRWITLTTVFAILTYYRRSVAVSRSFYGMIRPSPTLCGQQLQLSRASDRPNYLSSRTRSLRARSLKAPSPPSRMSQTAFLISAFSMPPERYEIGGRAPCGWGPASARMI